MDEITNTENLTMLQKNKIIFEKDSRYIRKARHILKNIFIRHKILG